MLEMNNFNFDTCIKLLQDMQSTEENCPIFYNDNKLFS